MSKPIYHEVKPLLVEGEYACFTRPELKAERVSYDVITPSAARGIVEAILWKPQISWRITQLHVLKEIMFVSLMRNEVSRKLPIGSVRTAYKTGNISELPIDPAKVRVQRRDRILRDVAYVIKAEFRCTSKAGPDDVPQKYIGMFHRRASKGQCHHRPYLGCREFPAHFELLEELPKPTGVLPGHTRLGWMLYDMRFDGDGTATAQYYEATIQDGVIRVPVPDSPEVKS